MRRETWERLESVFFRALELPPEDRPSFVESECGHDADFLREVVAVLASHAESGGTRGVSDPRRDVPAQLGPGTRVGPYEIEALIGRGGMGEVYRAHRADAQYEQRVAIKLVRPGGDSASLAERFNTERQILARLEHPSIATLLDGGMTERGQPYLVMQLVDGVPITTYVRQSAHSLGDRLELFLTVCHAVQYAHANLIVHRDLKPSNILVTTRSEVKLLDFGVAKLLDTEAWGGTPTADLLLLTPEHAAPEQFLGKPVTIATDVYALGILLYELLTGVRPFQALSPIELPRAVCENEPRLPSTRVGDPDWEPTEDEPQAPVSAQAIQGDLDAIVLKAISKDPARRYASVADLGDDVRRSLNGFPVEARHVTWGYVAGRFVRRHRAAVAAGMALALVLTALVVVSVRFAITSNHQTRRIAEERDVAVGVSTFLEDLFEAPDPYGPGEGRRDTLQIGTFIGEGAEKVRTDLVAQPVVQARLLTVLGRVYGSLGRHEEARVLLEEALEIRQEELGKESLETASTLRSLANVTLEKGQAAEAEELFRSARSILETDSTATGVELSRTLSGLGSALMRLGRFAEAESAFRGAADLGAETLEVEVSQVAAFRSGVAAALHRQGHLREAEEEARLALEMHRGAHGPGHARVAGSLNNLGTIQLDLGVPEDAKVTFEEALVILEAQLPDPHPRLATLLSNLAVAQMRTGDLGGAEAGLREALAMQREMLGNDHPAVAGTVANLSAVVRRAGRIEESFDLDHDALRGFVASLGPDHPTVATGHNNLGVALHLMERHEDALESFRAALAIRREKLPPDHPLTASTLSKIGQCLLDVGRVDEAEPLLRESQAMYVQWKDEEASQWDHVLGLMVRLLEETDRSEEAAEYAAMRPSTVDEQTPSGR